MSPLGSVACCRWNLALISRPALARNERNQFGPRPTEGVAYSCLSGVAESRIRVPWILSGSNGARIDVINLQQLSVSRCSSSAKSAFHGVGHRHWVAPICLAGAIAFGGGFAKLPRALWPVSVLFLSFVWPLSFAYAVVRHRVLEIPVLLKRSARYLPAQRGFTILLLVLWLAAIRLFTFAVSGLVGTFSNTVLVLGLVFGVGLVWFSAPAVDRATERIDRAFFRSAYDARQILESLVGETRTVTSREELAALLGGEIKKALHPVFAAVYLADRDGQLLVYPNAPATGFPPLLSRTPLLEELARRNEPWQISDIDTREAGYPTI